MCNLFDFGPKWVMSMKWYIGGRHFYRKTALCTREKDAADTIIHVVWCVIFSSWNVKCLQCLILWCCSNPWFYSTKRFYVNIIFSLNSAASDFLSESIKFEDWFYFTAKRNVVAAGGFILACCLLWNVVRAKCGGGSSFDNITCTFLSRKLNFIFWICSMIGYFWDFEIWSRV